MAVAGSAAAAPATTLSSSAAFGTSSGVQQLGAVRSPASLPGSRTVALRASQSSHQNGHVQEQSPVKSKVLVALVAAGAALALNVAPATPAHAGLFGPDNLKVERGVGLPDVVGDAKDAVQRKVAGAKDMAENAKSTVDGGGLPDPPTVAEGAKSNALPNPLEAGKALMSKITGN